jgi:hypothetical protein
MSINFLVAMEYTSNPWVQTYCQQPIVTLLPPKKRHVKNLPLPPPLLGLKPGFSARSHALAQALEVIARSTPRAVVRHEPHQILAREIITVAAMLYPPLRTAPDESAIHLL